MDSSAEIISQTARASTLPPVAPMNQPAAMVDVATCRQGQATLYKNAVSLAVIVSIIALILFWRMGSNTLIACAFFGAFLIHLSCRPGRRHLGFAAAAGIASVLIYELLGGPWSPFSREVLSFVWKDHGFKSVVEEVEAIGGFIGVGSIFVMALDRVWTGSSRYAVPLRDALILPAFSLAVSLSLILVVTGSHVSFDVLLYRFDLSLGLTPGPVVVSWFRKMPWIETGSYLIYTGVLFFPALFHAWACYRGKSTGMHLLHAYMVVGVGGLLYAICPAMGPKYAFGAQFPDHLPAIASVPAKGIMSTGVFNAMPSLHMAWALLLWVAAWKLGRTAVTIASVVAIFTGLATVGFGEHYFIDLIVAMPVVMIVYGLCAAHHKLTALGLAFVLAWTLYLRTGIQLPSSVNWLLVILTAVTTVFLMRPFLARSPRA